MKKIGFIAAIAIFVGISVWYSAMQRQDRLENGTSPGDLMMWVSKGDDLNLTKEIQRMKLKSMDVAKIINNPQADQGGSGMTALVYAITGKHYSTAKILLDEGADPNIVQKNENGEVLTTPLMLAISNGSDVSLIKSLVNHGADVTQTDSSGNTALKMAKNSAVLAILREHVR